METLQICPHCGQKMRPSISISIFKIGDVVLKDDIRRFSNGRTGRITRMDFTKNRVFVEWFLEKDGQPIKRETSGGHTSWCDPKTIKLK